jgi:hypothetical protein
LIAPTLTSIALVGILESEIAEFKAEAELPAKLWREAARNYTIYAGYPNAM